MDTRLHPDRLFPADPALRARARGLYEAIAELPILSPHGHTEPEWFASDTAFADAAALFVIPDHYVLRMLRSQGVSYDDLGVPRRDGGPVAAPRDAWRAFASRYHLFAGTPSGLWLDHALHWGFGVDEAPSSDTADALFDRIGARLAEPGFRPRAILDRARVEVIATTDFALADLSVHERIAAAGLAGRVRPTYRPDDVTDPDAPDFAANIARFAALTGEDTARYPGLIAAHRRRRAQFRALGATATDHGPATAATADLSPDACQALLTACLDGSADAGARALFRAQMLTEMAGLSAEDGMVMQIHPGSVRSTDPAMLAERGANMGADIPRRESFVESLAPLLNRYGQAEGLRIVLFTLDESTYARELAPMAGYWPCLRLGPPWWFHDSPNGIRRYLDQVWETAGHANLAGFNDDTRALLSIPARHDVWRRMVAGFLAGLVAEHRLSQASAAEFAAWLAHGAAKATYRL